VSCVAGSWKHNRTREFWRNGVRNQAVGSMNAKADPYGLLTTFMPGAVVAIKGREKSEVS
jgi:hypothetical protein